WMDANVHGNDGVPEQIIVVYDPPGKGMDNLENQHFVCNVSCRSNPDRVNVDICVGTAQLRVFERIDSNSLIRLTLFINTDMPYWQGMRQIDVGVKLWNRDNFTQISRIFNISSTNETDIVTFINHTMRQPGINHTLLKLLLGEKNYKIVKYIENRILDQWWEPPFALPHLMQTLDEIYSLEVLEIQGRYDSLG